MKVWHLRHLWDARRRPSTAELLQGAKRTSVRITQGRSTPWTAWRCSCGSRGSWLRLGWGLWMERGDLPGGGFSGAYFFLWPRPEAWILSFRFPNIGWIAVLGVIHCWDLHPHFIVVIGKMKIWQNCQIFRVNSCKWMQMRPIAYIGACWMKVWHLRHLWDARRRPSTAELLQGTKRTSVRITHGRSPPWTSWRCSCGSRGSWLRPGGGLWGERWPFWMFR